jgi:hypothetical protein
MRRISLIQQEGALRSYFPNSTIKRNGDRHLIWIHDITPSPISEKYRVKLYYKRGGRPKIYVLDALKLAPGKTKLPHVYSTDEQRLCLYYPKYREWTPKKYFVKTIIPWISEWIYHYEIWVVTGEWHGGGIEHETEEEKAQES